MEEASTLTDILLPASQLVHSFSSSRASQLNQKVQNSSVQPSFWTNRQKIRTPEQFSSTAKELYSTVLNATHIPKGAIMGKLEGKVAVITGGSSGMALASAKLFVEEGAYVFITGRKQEQLDEAAKLIGRNVTGVRGDAANLDDLDRLFDTVKREKGKIDVLFASAGKGEAVPLGEITEQHFDAAFGLNTRGTLGYAIYDINRPCDADLMAQLKAVPHTITVRAKGC